MSLINKMLQDLDARRSDVTGGDALGIHVRPVPRRPRNHAAWGVAAALGAGLVGVIAWELLSPTRVAEQGGVSRPIVQEKKAARPATPTPPVPASPPAASSQPAPVTSQAVPAAAPDVKTDSPAPAAPAEPATDKAAASALAHAIPARQAEKPPMKEKAPVEAAHPRKSATADKPAHAEKPRTVPAPVARAAPAPEFPRAAQEKSEDLAPPPRVATPATPAAPLGLNKQVKELTPQQRADNDYRKALSQIQQGLTADAISTLGQVLQQDAYHVAARQSLIGLLLENKRQDEALRLARAGLNLDGAQPGLAMIAARLQVEKGELKPAIDTLEKALPYAAERADYQSFLAALLQRDGRYKESVDHYLLALQKAPQNGVWWMGLGISLQADHRPAEAQEAYARAKATNALSPELLAFVESKLRQLQR